MRVYVSVCARARVFIHDVYHTSYVSNVLCLRFIHPTRFPAERPVMKSVQLHPRTSNGPVPFWQNDPQPPSLPPQAVPYVLSREAPYLG